MKTKTLAQSRYFFLWYFSWSLQTLRFLIHFTNGAQSFQAAQVFFLRFYKWRRREKSWCQHKYRLTYIHVVTHTTVVRGQAWSGPSALLGSQRLQKAAMPTGQREWVVDSYTSGLSTGVVIENMGFVATPVACETCGISAVRACGWSLPLNHI